MTNMCLKCAETRDTKHKSVMGCWVGKCEFCGEEGVTCASAEHDFGVYKTEEDRLIDKVNDLI
jgi:hypothetical protein